MFAALKEFQPGNEVQIHGLQTAVHLNGHSAVLVSFNDSTQRWAARLEDGTTVNVKPQNIALQEATREQSTQYYMTLMDNHYWSPPEPSRIESAMLGVDGGNSGTSLAASESSLPAPAGIESAMLAVDRGDSGTSPAASESSPPAPAGIESAMLGVDRGDSGTSPAASESYIASPVAPPGTEDLGRPWSEEAFEALSHAISTAQAASQGATLAGPAAMELDRLVMSVRAGLLAGKKYRKVNGHFFRQLPVGSDVLIAGQILVAGILLTTDRDTIAISGVPANTQAIPGYVEVCGTKTTPDSMEVDDAPRWLDSELHCETWDAAIQMRHHPELRRFFDPDMD